MEQTSSELRRRPDFSLDWQAEYQRKLVSAEAAAALVRSGDHIYIAPGHAGEAISLALTGRMNELEDVEIKAMATADYGWYEPEFLKRFRMNVYMGMAASREAMDQKLTDFTPWFVHSAHKALDDGRPEPWRMDFTWINVGAPNARGFCCFGPSLWDAATSSRRARTVVAEINPHVPTVFGDTFIHVTEIDYIVEHARPLGQRPSVYPPPDPWDPEIARLVGTLIQDGDCVQIGTGSTTGNLNRLGALQDKNDLGYFAELTVPGTIDLVKQGVITGRYLNLHPRKFVTSSAGNDQQDWEYMADNPFFEMRSVDYVHHIGTISQINNMVAVNNAMVIDLTGQIGSSAIGPRNWSGTGGQFSFAVGAFLAPKGKSIHVLPSTARGGTLSRIVPRFEPGQIVTVPRDLADIVVTEFGVAQLLNKTERQRADALIEISHPDFRAELRKAARSFFWP